MDLYESTDYLTCEAIRLFRELGDCISASEFMLYAFHSLGTPLFHAPEVYWSAVDLYSERAKFLKKMDVPLFENSLPVTQK